MPKKRQWLTALAITPVLLSGWATVAQALPSILIVDQGAVSIQSNGQGPWRSVQYGVLGDTDFIRTTDGVQASLYCPGRLRGLPVPINTTRSVNSLCNVERRSFRPFDLAGGIGDLRGGGNPDAAYVLTPRNGFVYNDRPTLAWNKVEGASRYTVQLGAQRRRTSAEPDEILWEITTDQTQIDYPADQAPLVGNRYYQLIVTPDVGLASSEEETAAEVFNLLASPTLANDIAVVKQLELPQALEAFNIANVYVENGFLADAIATLQSALFSMEEDAQLYSPTLYRGLGDSYLASGLSIPAEMAYQQVLEQANLQANLEDWMAAQIGLGQLYQALERSEQAEQRFRQAELAAVYLCDSETLEALKTVFSDMSGDDIGQEDIESDAETTQLTCVIVR